MINEILNTIIKQVEILEKNGFDFEKLAKQETLCNLYVVNHFNLFKKKDGK